MKYYRMRQHDGLGECNSFVQNDLKFLRVDDILVRAMNHFSCEQLCIL